MDTKSNLDNDTKIQKLMRDVGTFIVMYEQADDRLNIQKENLDNNLLVFKKEIQDQIKDIKGATVELNEVLSAAGAARWRIAAEKALKQGADHLTTMRDLCDTYKKLSEESVAHLDHVAHSTEQRIISAVQHISDKNSAVVHAFKERTQVACEEIDAAARGTINTIRILLRWLRWERIATAVIAGLVSAFVVAIYINAESPIAAHHRSIQERLIGKTVLTVWPTLSKSKQDEVNQILGTDID